MGFGENIVMVSQLIAGANESDEMVMRFQALVFDLDGTLVDSKIDFAAMRAELSLNKDHDVLKTIATWPKVDQVRAHEIIHRHERSGAESSTLIDGAKEFINQARSMNIPCSVFTRNSRDTTLWSLEQHGILCDHIVSREDLPPKPDPAGLHSIARRCNVDLSQMLFVGDYLYDLQAGLRAGVATALYLPQPADFDTTGATLIFKSYRELGEWLF